MKSIHNKQEWQMRNVKFYSILYEVVLWSKDNTNIYIPYQHRTKETALNANLVYTVSPIH